MQDSWDRLIYQCLNLICLRNFAHLEGTWCILETITRKPVESKVYKCQRITEHVLRDSLRDRIDDRVFKRRIQSRPRVHSKMNKWEDRVTRVVYRWLVHFPNLPIVYAEICLRPSRVLNIEIISRREVTAERTSISRRESRERSRRNVRNGDIGRFFQHRLLPIVLTPRLEGYSDYYMKLHEYDKLIIYKHI